MPERKKDLTAKQKLFVFHYCNGSNARYAAVAAGYSGKSAHSQASRLVRNPYIHNAIVARLDRRKKMPNDRYASFFLFDPKANDRAKIKAAAHFLDKQFLNHL